jgi:hypothetical protein
MEVTNIGLFFMGFFLCLSTFGHISICLALATCDCHLVYSLEICDPALVGVTTGPGDSCGDIAPPSVLAIQAAVSGLVHWSRRHTA